ncbi:Holliday junction resolvase RuvX [Bacilliculturomica massiliensis]|uniref:Holliday junction resolvase RuvX n=1 Tax=Bacilliculturomica massiliensis TaxID=1917867 RepID=UPI00102FA813|nr:Holliday junction resolvase RuvX [Bacilliculturomica massiliensis]
MKCISLDVGDKTIGVAVSDGLLLTAQGLMTIERVGIRKDADKVLALAKEHGADTIVIGLPRNLDGSDSIQTEKVRDFRTMLENKIRSSGIKDLTLEWQDERFTTKIAENVLIQADVSRKKRKDVIDKQAAVIILQSFLDRYHNLKKAAEKEAAQEDDA